MLIDQLPFGDRSKQIAGKIRKPMMPLRFFKFIVLITISTFFASDVLGQESISTCNCTENSDRVRDEIVLSNTDDYVIVSYPGSTSTDSVLWRNQTGDTHYYLGFTNPEDDTIRAGDAFVAYRDGGFAYDSVRFINVNNSTDTISVSLEECNALSPSGIMRTPDQDTICFTEPYDLSVNVSVDTIDWIIRDSEGAIVRIDSNSTDSMITFTADMPGMYSVEAIGETDKNCPINTSQAIFYVIDNRFDINGPVTICDNGDEAQYNVDNGDLALYDTSYWSFGEGNVTGTFESNIENTPFVTIDWAAGTGERDVIFTAIKEGVCNDTIRDTLTVQLTDVIMANFVGPDVVCEGERAIFRATNSTFTTTRWALDTTYAARFVGSSSGRTDVTVEFREPTGNDSIGIFFRGITTSGCEVLDTFYAEVRSEDAALLRGDTVVCIGSSSRYAIGYDNGDEVDIESISWRVSPALDEADTTLLGDSIEITWLEVGTYDLMVSASTVDGCTISNTFAIEVQDTTFEILGDTLVCSSHFDEDYKAMFHLVQSADSNNVIEDSRITWRVELFDTNNPGPGGRYINESVDEPNNDTLFHAFRIGTFGEGINTAYRVIAEVERCDGGTVRDTIIVESIGEDNLMINQIDSIDCSGALDAEFTLNFPDSLFESGPIWSVQYSNGTMLAPTFIDDEKGDTVVVRLPYNTEDIYTLRVSGNIVGAQCPVSNRGFSLSSTTFAVTDSIYYVDTTGARRDRPVVDTVCLSNDSLIYVLRVGPGDSVDLNDPNLSCSVIFPNGVSRALSCDSFDLATLDSFSMRGGTGIMVKVPVTMSGRHRIIIENNGGTCSYSELATVHVLDTSYIASGDMQICVGDTASYAFLDSFTNMPVTELYGDDQITWEIRDMNNNPVPLASGDTIISGDIRDSIQIVFDQEGVYRVRAYFEPGYRTCDFADTCEVCQLDAEFNVVVRGMNFITIGPDPVCEGSVAQYHIANIDSSRIDDFIADSISWGLLSGENRIVSRTDADSVMIDWSYDGEVFSSRMDTIVFRGVTNDGCVIVDTMPIEIVDDAFTLLGNVNVCASQDIQVLLRKAADSSMVEGLDTVMWILAYNDDNGIPVLDTIITPSHDTLDRLDQDGNIRMWPRNGVYSVRAIGMTETGCTIDVMEQFNIFNITNVDIVGDMNTCIGTDRRPASSDVYSLDIEGGDLVSVAWEIIPLGNHPNSLGPNVPFTMPTILGSMTDETLHVAQWNDAGHATAGDSDFRIVATGTTTGGCSFADSVDVTIASTDRAFQMSCNNGVNITVPFECELTLTADMILEDFEELGVPVDEFEVIVADSTGQRVFSSNGEVDRTLLDQKLQVTVVHECTGQNCWGYVRLEDKTIPELLCASDTIMCNESINPFVMDFNDERFVGFPVPPSASVTAIPSEENTFVVRDFEQCGDAILRYEDEIETGCDGDFGTIVYRHWELESFSVTYDGVEPFRCTDTIYIERLNIDTFINMIEDLLIDTTLECGVNDNFDFSNITNSLGEFCFNIKVSDAEQKVDTLCDGNFRTTRELRTWTILDWCTGEVRKVRQRITIADTHGPDIDFESDTIRVFTDDHHCYGPLELTLDDIDVTDLCSPVRSMQLRIREGSASGDIIVDTTYTLMGDTLFTGYTITDPEILEGLEAIHIRVTATDQCGNRSQDTITRPVLFIDDVSPSVSCDEIININLNSEGWAFAAVNAFIRGASDNCELVDTCIVRMDDLDIFDSLDRRDFSRDSFVLYQTFVEAVQAQMTNNNISREGNDYSDRTTMIFGGEYIHRDSLCIDKLKFECYDALEYEAGRSLMVQLIVTDDSGNKNICMSEVRVRDNGLVAKVDTARQDTTISCGTDYTDLLPYDEDKTVRFFTACDIPLTPEYRVDSSGLNSCGQGVIRRIFTVRNDRTGSTYTHVHRIFVGSDAELINPDNIRNFWPPDYDGEGCVGSDISFDNLPVRFRPAFDPDDYPCSDAALDWNDEEFFDEEGFCVKILRTWILKDWCQKDEANNGEWRHTQVIRLNDNDAPVIDVEEEVEMTTSAANSCQASVTITATATDCHDAEDIDWTYRVTRDGAMVVQGNSPVLSGILPVGVYEITWTATDQCGNIDTAMQMLTVNDGAAPTVSCENVNQSLDNSGTVTIAASAFAGETMDDCSGDDIRYYFGSPDGDSTRTFRCSDLEGQASREILVEIYAVDAVGNAANCSANLTLSDNSGNCGNGIGSSQIEGEIRAASGAVLNDVNLTLNNRAGQLIAEARTDEAGQYSFPPVKLYDNYVVSASRDNDDWLDGVTSLDIVILQRHILGLTVIDNPYLVIAGDVTGDYRVNGSDLTDLRRILLGRTSEFATGHSWLFVDAEQTFEYSYDPFPYETEIPIDNLSGNMGALDFVAVKVGDVDQSGAYGNSALATSRSAQASSWIVRSGQRSGNREVHFYPSEQVHIAGWQTAIRLPEGVAVEAIHSDWLAMDESLYVIEDNTIQMSVSSATDIQYDPTLGPLFVLILDGQSSVSIDEITLDKQRMKSEVYQVSDERIGIHELNLEYENLFEKVRLEERSTLSVAQNKPNPFVNQTTIEYTTHKAGVVELNVFDLSGRLLYHDTEYNTGGVGHFEVYAHDLNNGGVYIYEVENGTEIVTKKMMLLE